MRFARHYVLLLLAILGAVVCARSARADDAPLFEQEPFDTITLDNADKNAVLKVQPLDLPNRQLPEKPNPNDELEIHLLDRPRKAYKLAWEHITEIKLFERRVLDEAERLSGAGKFDEAYPYYEFLGRRYPKMAELDASYEKFLLAGAGAAYKQTHYEESLGLLWDLFDRNPQHKGVVAGIQRVAGKLFDQWLAEENYAAARGILHEVEARLKDQAEPMASDGKGRLQKLAAQRLAQAKEEFKAGRYAEARRACRQALAAWPEIEGGTALAGAMQAKYPIVEVGVTAIEADRNPSAGDRTTRLLTRSLAEPTRLDGEAPVYETPLLASVSSADRRLSLTVKPGIHWSGGSAITAADVARTLLAEADPRSALYRPQWAKLLVAVALPAVDRVDVELKQPLQHPESWLDVPMWRADGSQGGYDGLGPYTIASRSPEEIRYLAIDDYFAAGKSEPREIVERRYPSTEAALSALRRGEVQIVDRVSPFAGESLKESSDIAVEPYALPTLHLIAFNRGRPMTSNAMFRRAVAHAIDRQGILNDALSHGIALPGARIANAVWTHGPGEPANAAELRYDPAAASVLMQVAIAEGGRQFAGGAAARSPLWSTPAAAASPAALALEYPPEDVARIACAAIQRQFQAIGLPLKLRERSAESASAGEASDADLCYIEWQPGKPAGSLIPFRGAEIAGAGGADLAELLSQAATATSAEQPNAKQADAEQTIMAQTLLIPLWRLTESVAYRRELHGVGNRPLTLYQNVEQWRIGGGGE